MRRPFENDEWQIAMVLRVMIIERELLLAIRRIIRVVQIQDNGGRGLSVAGNKVIHQGSRATIEVFAVYLVFKPWEGGRTRQVLLWLQGAPFDPQFEHGVMAEVIGVIRVRISWSKLIDALGQQVSQGMINIGLVSFIVDSGSEALSQANLAVDTT
jgi:hypothetical protein